eukprot:2923150-Rhodomonas_salina.4
MCGAAIAYAATFLCARGALSGADLAYGMGTVFSLTSRYSGCARVTSGPNPHSHLCCAMRGSNAVKAARMEMQARKSGAWSAVLDFANVGSGVPIFLGVCYAMSGTEVAYGACCLSVGQASELRKSKNTPP